MGLIPRSLLMEFTVSCFLLTGVRFDLQEVKSNWSVNTCLY